MTPLNLYLELRRMCRYAHGAVVVLIFWQVSKALSDTLAAWAVSAAVYVLVYIAMGFVDTLVRAQVKIVSATIIVQDRGKTERLYLEGDARLVEKFALDADAKVMKEWRKD